MVINNRVLTVGSNIGLHIVTVIGNRIAVQHINIVVGPKTPAPTAFFIFIIEAYIDFMNRFVQELPRHVGVCLIDCMEPRISQFSIPVLIKSLLYFKFQTRYFSLADILKAVNHIGSIEEFGSPP